MVAGGVLGIGLLFITEGAAGELGFAPAALGAELIFGGEDGGPCKPRKHACDDEEGGGSNTPSHRSWLGWEWDFL
jgi:hypothetical protein